MYGGKLQVLLDKHHIKQKQMAEITGFPQSSVSRYLNEEYPPLEFIEAVCAHFGIPLWKFFATEETSYPDMTPEEIEIIRLFRLFPEDIKARFVRINRGIAELLSQAIETALKKK